MNTILILKYVTVFFLFVDPELHNTCWLKKDVYDPIDKEGVISGFITDECKGKKIRFKKKRIHHGGFQLEFVSIRGPVINSSTLIEGKF